MKLVVTPAAQADFVDIARHVAELTGNGPRGVGSAARGRTLDPTYAVFRLVPG